MKSLYCLVVFAVLLGSCSTVPSGNVVQTAIAQTQIAQPILTPIPSPTEIPTPTPIPLSDIDLESILLLSGDLPTDIIGGQVRSNPPKGLGSLPEADQVIQQGFRADELASDGVTIFLYDSISDLDKAYEMVAQIEGLNSKRTLYGVGEKGAFSVEELGGLPLIGGGSIPGGTSVKLVFSRCHALVYIDLFSPNASEDVATTYAQRLDERITPLVCR
jgi:hypothetical protein